MIQELIGALNQQFGEQAEVTVIDATRAGERLGYYDHNIGLINICEGNMADIEELVHVCLHEYAHFLQHIEEPTCFDYYKQECTWYGYEHHPLELAAEQFAELWKNKFLGGF